MHSKNLSLPALPYEYEALSPVISPEILHLHHDKHHAGYVTKAVACLDKLETARASNGPIDQKATLKDLSFNLNGHILHDLYWSVMRAPRENNVPPNEVLAVIVRTFGSFERFKQEFTEAAVSVEGSGWCLLASNEDDDLVIMQVENHQKLALIGYKPLMVIDVWEHAYYLDYKNDRASYVNNWWRVVNWEEVKKRLSN